ncbi:hypothetical protein EON63_21830 [archaeon]|nr:MAG: hypothetical protein EON63_21830 [archaeon]
MVTIHNACTHIISRHASQDMRKLWVGALCKFEKMASFGLTEPGMIMCVGCYKKISQSYTYIQTDIYTYTYV